MAAMPTVKTLKRGTVVHTACVHCKAQLEYLPPPASSSPPDEPFTLECAQCGQTWINRPQKPRPQGKRRIGSDERPLETEYYDLLGLPITCTPEDVKKAYRRLAIKYHPDKNPDDPTAADKFKEIAVAYTTLSDPQLRKKYNEYGRSRKDGGEADEMVDPEAIFSTLFGGERFQDIIGTISLGSEMKSAMQADEDDDDETSAAAAGGSTVATTDGKGGKAAAKAPLTPEQEARKKAKEEQEARAVAEKVKVREQRVKHLADKLRDKLALYSEQASGEEDAQIAEGVRTMWTIEAEELKKESYGVELLHAVGLVYTMKSKHYLASTGPIPFGVGGWFHAAKSTAHIFNATVSTVRSAYALKDVYEAIQKAEQSGLPEEEKRKLEDKAAQMGLHALFKGAKLEVESVVREVCDRLLLTLAPEEANVPLPTLRKRAVALGILGEVYCAVQKDPNAPEGPLGAFGFGGAPPPAA
ncbi:X-domain of DnaJ-containing-domain-containing protein [Rhodotorula diobovata]|uniref:X-domain of DnaJ-containing-domain-containing protein n=1 Tax=Rhodotorula diobovata TaxID=5288 RepID=A0A5C5FZV7_9BASI|nr:X-domain of DnaJ-containing-domain-containing protein [Rhodotorula diobovata]